MIRDSRAQLASAVVLALLIVVMLGVLVDGLSWMMIRRRALQIAQSAALQGVHAGIDYESFLAEGRVGLVEERAREEALAAIREAAPWDAYAVQVEVLPCADEGGPAVEVFIEVPVRGLLWGETKVQVFTSAVLEVAQNGF